VPVEFEADLPEERLLAEIDRLNQDPSIDGILLQLPLPKHINPDRVIERIAPGKDVDGFHPTTSAGWRRRIRCCAPARRTVA